MSDHPSEHPSQASKSEIESQSKPESEVFRTSHSYNDGNITLDIRGTKFKLHKSILTLHSEAFKDMFGLPEVHPVESQDTPVSLDDDPKAFDAALNAIYKGVEFIRGANIIQLMDAITITHKYQMNRLEGYLQDHITERILPSSASDGVNGFGFDHYDEHPGLATAVLRLGADELVPWAFYSVGVNFFSGIDIDNASTYGPPPTWFAFDPELSYSFLVLRQIVHNTFEDWDKRISDFYASSCSRAANARFNTSAIKCARKPANYGSGSPLYISPNQKGVDLVREMAPRIKRLATTLTEQDDVLHFGWCSKCNATIKGIGPSVLNDMYPKLVDCVTRMKRMRPRC